MSGSSCGTCLLVIATILGPIVLVLLAISFGTDHWLEYTVNRSLLKNTAQWNISNTNLTVARYTHTRFRGFFRECYPGTDTKFLEVLGPKDETPMDNHCFRVRYELPDLYDNNREYISRIHLIRCWLAFFVIALAMYLLSYMFGLVLCCWRQSKWAYVAGFLAYFAAFSTATSIAFFHGAEYMERNRITYEDPIMGKFYFGFDSLLKQATSRDYGYSYIIGWIGMIIAAIAATFYSIAGCYIGGERYDEKAYLKKSRAKDYLERSYPLPLEPSYKEYYGYPGYGYNGPYLYDMDARQALPAIAYGPEPVQGHYMWH